MNEPFEFDDFGEAPQKSAGTAESEKTPFGKLADLAARAAEETSRLSNLEPIMRIPVTVQVLLGSATMPVADLMKLGRGAVIPLDHRVGEPVEVVVNGRIVARGAVVVVEDDNSRFGVSLTEIVGGTATGEIEA
jgi:flagellar motor switch protein FliN/FliY